MSFPFFIIFNLDGVLGGGVGSRVGLGEDSTVRIGLEWNGVNWIGIEADLLVCG